MGSIWGQTLKISLFGESHGRGIGVVLDNLPPGEPLDEAAIRGQLDRRRPGREIWSTPRSEFDVPEILSGFWQGRTTGTPLAAIIRNKDTRSEDYRNLETIPRPGHADLTGLMRYDGAGDPRGGGHFSGRITAPLTFAGAVCAQILARRGVAICAHIAEIAGIPDRQPDPAAPDLPALQKVRDKLFPVLDDAAGEAMKAAIEAARMDTDSVGGVIQVIVTGFPAGIGDPMFGGLEPQLASILMAIPAVKGVEFGDGFAAARRRGSQNNDSPAFVDQDGQKQIRLRTNHGGGADGGISNGMPLCIRIAVKPTASIGREQDSIDLTREENTRLVVRGRHDPCIVPRALPVAESAVAVCLLDRYLTSGHFK
ncbi:chorismate synthase [Oscillospiraceae bacterium HV4-5-C5C]|nr:chorismate synthase [Oscillospiraceae bacterium HV4-5-C5C]